MKIEGFGDYDFSKAELKSARIPKNQGGGYDAVYLTGLAIWPAFKAEQEAKGEISFEDLIKAKS